MSDAAERRRSMVERMRGLAKDAKAPVAQAPPPELDCAPYAHEVTSIGADVAEPPTYNELLAQLADANRYIEDTGGRGITGVINRQVIDELTPPSQLDRIEHLLTELHRQLDPHAIKFYKEMPDETDSAVRAFLRRLR